MVLLDVWRSHVKCPLYQLYKVVFIIGLLCSLSQVFRQFAQECGCEPLQLPQVSDFPFPNSKLVGLRAECAG